MNIPLLAEKSYLTKNIDKINIVRMASSQNKESQQEILKTLTDKGPVIETQEKLDNIRELNKYGIDVKAENEDSITISFPDLKDKNGEPISITMPKEDFGEDETDFKTKLKEALDKNLKPLSLDDTVREAANNRVQSMLTEGNLSERLRAVATDPLVYTGDKIDGSIDLLLEEPGQTNKFATLDEQRTKLDKAMEENKANMRTVAAHHRDMGKRDGANKKSTDSEYRKKF